MRMTKTLSGQRVCAGWFEASLGAHVRRYVFSWCCPNEGLKGLDTLGRFSVIVYRGDNFCDFLFAFIHTQQLRKGGLLKSKFFLFRVDPKGSQTELLLLTVYQFPLVTDAMFCNYPANTQRRYNVAATSRRCDDVITTLCVCRVQGKWKD